MNANHSVILKEAKLKKINKLADKHGYSDILPSSRKSKKYMTWVNNKWVHFGAALFQDWHDHQNPQRRVDYIRRHGAIRLKDGRIAHKVWGTPAHLSMYLLWPPS